MSFGAFFSAAAPLIGAVGGAKKGSPAQSQSGFATLPTAQKDFMNNEIFDMIRRYQSTPYQGIPMRRMTAQDADLLFGSQARMDYQNMLDARNAQAQAQEQKPAEEVPNSDIVGMLGKLFLEQQASQMTGKGGTQGAYRHFANNANKQDMSSLMQALMAGGFGQPINANTDAMQLINKYRRG